MRHVAILPLVALIFCSCETNLGSFTAENKGGVDQINRTFVIDADDLSIESTKDLAVVAIDKDGNNLPTQNDDIDGDGIWDQIAFAVDLKAGESTEINFKEVKSLEQFNFTTMTNVRFGSKAAGHPEVYSADRLNTTDNSITQSKFQMEGPAWENDIVGFRNYYDNRNGIDIFGKRVPEMALDGAGINGQNYHDLATWGMDVLKVGNSLGAGSIAISIGDSLYRVGPSEKGSYKLITEGVVRSIIELKFEGVKMAGRKYDITHLISINAGDSFYRSEVSVDGFKGDESIVTGIVDLHEMPLVQNSYKDHKIISTFGAQAYEGKLGMAIAINESSVDKIGTAPKEGEGVTFTHTMKLKEANKANFIFIVGWEYQDSKYSEESNFIELCKNSIDRI